MRRALLLALLAGSASASDVPVFSTSVEIVRLDVSVTRDGTPVAGLLATDFEIRDEGELRSAQIVDGAGKRIQAVIALDTSSSLMGPPLGHLKKAAHALLDVLHEDDSLALLTFSDRVTLLADPDLPRGDVHALIDGTAARHTTSLVDAAFTALSMAGPTRGRTLILLFSDGQDVGSWLASRRVLEVARRSDVVVHAVATRSEGADLGFLRELTSSTGGELWLADHRDLETALPRAVEEFRSRYTLQFEAGSRGGAGWRGIKVKLRHGDGSIRARPGYWRN